MDVHAYGTPAAQAPVPYLTAAKDEDSTAIYFTSLERAWTTAEPLR
ncbi:hypothetical protein [Microbispora bryophytorum]